MEILERPPLYKYRAFGGAYGDENIHRILSSNEMHWQSPVEFNDPFDCLPRITKGDPAAWARHVRELAKRRRPDANREERRRIEAQILRRSDAVVQETAQSAIRGQILQCFSLEADSLMLWAYYADNHTGVCFDFRQLGEPQPFLAIPVEYVEERPTADISRMIEPDHKFLIQSLHTKAKCWEHEREARMIRIEATAPGFYKFSAAALVGVRLGARIDPANREIVLALVAQHRPDITVQQARLHDDEYKLTFDPV